MDKYKIITISIIVILVLALIFVPTYVILYNKGIICFPNCDSCTPKHPCGVTISESGATATRDGEIISGGGC